MSGLSDFLFGSGALKKAAGPNAPKNTSPSQPAGLDMARLAQESADRQKAQESKSKSPASGSPLSTTMTTMPNGRSYKTSAVSPEQDADLARRTKKAK